MRVWGRRAAWALAALAAVAVVLLVVVQSTPIETRVRAWLVVQVKRLWRLDLAAADLDYNLLTRRATLTGVALSADGHADDPIFKAARVSVQVPWAAYTGTLRLSSLVIDDGVVTLIRERGQMVNLPPSSGQPPPEVPRHLDLRGLTARNLRVDYVDRTGDIDVTVAGMDIALSEVQDRLGVSAGGTIAAESVRARVGEKSTTSRRVEGRMGFDGSHVTLDRLTAPFPEATLVASGRVNRVLDDTSFDLTLEGTLDMAPLVAWAPPPVPVSGAGTFTGTMRGPLSGNEIRLAFEAPGLTIARATGMPLDGDVSITSARALVERFRLIAPGAARAAGRPGTIEGKAQYTFGAGSIELEAAFRDLDLDVAMAAYDREPLIVAAWEEGTATLTRAGPTAPRRLRAQGRSAPLARADRVAIEGTWDVTLQDGRWIANHDHQLLDTVRASGRAEFPDVIAPAPAPLSGPLAIEVSDVGRAVAAARRSGIDVSESLESFGGPVQGTFELGGTLDGAIVRGRAESARLTLPTGAVAVAAADLELDPEAAVVPRFELTGQGLQIAGDVRMALESGALAGSLSANLTSMPDFVRPWLPDQADALAGTGQLTATLGGTSEVPDVPWQLTSTPIAHGEQTIGALSGEGRLLGTAIQVDRLHVEQGPGTADGSGRYDYESGAYTASVRATGLRVGQPLVGDVVEAVVVDAQFEGSGTLDEPAGTGFVRAVPEGGRVAELVGISETRLQLAGGRVQGRMYVPNLHAFVDASVSPSAPYDVRGTAVVNQVDVEPLALASGLLEGTVSGTTSFSASFEGLLSDTSTLEAFVNLQEVSVSAGGVPIRLERPARVMARLDDFSVDDLALQVGQGVLTARGKFRDSGATPLQAEFSGPLGDLVALGRVVGATTDVNATGEVTATWESRNGLDTALGTAKISNGQITWGELPPIEALYTETRFDGSMLVVDYLTASWQGGGIEGYARVPRGLLEAGPGRPAATPGRVDVSINGLTHEALRPWLPATIVDSIDARVSADLGLDLASAQVSGIAGTLVLSEASLTAAGVPISQARPAHMSIADGVLYFDDVAFSAGEPVMFGGSVAFGETITLDMTVTGTPGLRPLSVLSPQLAVDGLATLNVYLTGPAAAPKITGRIDLEDGEVVMRNPRVIASDISGPILFEGDTIRIPGMTGGLNGGSLDASGRVDLDGLQLNGGEITFQARAVAVEYPRDVDTEIDALLTLIPPQGATGTPLLRGDVRVLRGAYRGIISLPGLVAFNRAPARPTAGSSAMDAMRLDIALSTEEDLVVDNNYGQFEAGASLRLVGTVGKPGVTGRVDLREGGEIYLLGGLYRLDQSNISFSDPAAIAPDLNISMSTRSSGNDTTVTLSGTLDRLETNVSSTDPNANETLASVLLGGTELGGDEALALLSGQLLGVTGRRIGLDSLRVERGFDTDMIRQDPGLIAEDIDPSTRLTMSKRLRSNVEVILSQDLRQNGGLSAVISYRPIRSVEVRAISRDNSDRALAVRHEITFGGTAVQTVKRDEVDVTAIEFEGAGADEPELRRRLKLTPGKRFDFVRWRDDVDRLQEWYRDQQHLEARVRASRAPGDGGTTLIYRVTPGPETTLTIEGTTPPSGLRSRLEEAWSDSVFDRFMLEEMQREVELDLVRRDVVGASVEASVTESNPARKAVLVRVRGGEQVAGRHLRWAGTGGVSAGALDQVLKLNGLEEYAWIDPTSVSAVVREHYIAEGFRLAQVYPELPRFEGDDAVLTVAVKEGPVTRVASVEFEGVAAEEQQPVVGAGRLAQQQVFKLAEVDLERQRIEQVYRRRGYNDVVVTPRIAYDDAASTAAVHFAVVPGRAQVLTEVVVEGNDRTHDGSVTGALGLKPGTPVDFAQWAQARKRVYDTNVFRQVEVRPEDLPSPGDGPESVRARVSVTEWPAWRLRYGLQLNDRTFVEPGGEAVNGRETDIGVVADIQNRNAFGRALTFGLYGRVERRLYSTSTYLTFPTLFRRAIQTNLFASSSRQDVPLVAGGAPELLRTRALVSVEQRIRRFGSFEASYGYRVTNERLVPFDEDNLFLQETLTGRFTGTALMDRRDDPFDAAKGWFSSVAVERITEFESGSDSIKALGTLYYYLPVGRITLASAVRLGATWLGVLPAPDRFFVGGADTIRGYPEGEAGPRNALGLPAGGDAQLILNEEVRLPIKGWLKGVVFLDAGNVYPSKRFLSFTDLAVGYGVGLRFDTPFSLFRLDLGIPSKGGGQRLYFGIGQVF